MLQHEHSEADEARVTAAELASALASLESHKEASGDTVALGEAVRELNLDATPQEILAEVEAQRARQNGKGRSTKRRLWGATTVALIALSTLGGIHALRHHAHTSSAPATASASLPAPPQGLLLQLTETTDQTKIFCCDATALTQVCHGKLLNDFPLFSGKGTERTIFQVPGGTQINHAKFTELVPSPWTLVSFGGTWTNTRLYVRGWVSEAVYQSRMQGRSVVLYNSPTAPGLGDTPHQVTVPTDRLIQSGSVLKGQTQIGPWEGITLSFVRLDQHAWAKW